MPQTHPLTQTHPAAGPRPTTGPRPAADPRSTARRVTGTFTFTHWDERPVAGEDGGVRIARADVSNDFRGGIESTATSCQYTIAYLGESGGAYVGHEFIEGTLDGREGSFVIEQRGSFVADGIECAFTVLPGSGTGELAGLSGTGAFTAHHGEKSTPYTLDYTLGV
ncbi:DUF3224 domain-containing protein [Streptomyces sp. NPDC050703]|uniref:DUF3224 domain-containing protein n=1 Tax=Streptomyces sp. NPDC050703 TaxID=3157218 RepID=UPI0034362784